MKLLKAVKTKWLAVIALFITAILVFSVFPIFSLTSRDTALAEESESVTYIDTDVEKIIPLQHPNTVYLGFRLEESDYDDCNPWGCEFSVEKNPQLAQYLAEDLTYWKNFSQMNTEGIVFNARYAYWNGSEVGISKFNNTVTHRTSLQLLEYGFVVSIPKGTTFPSQTYVAGGCEGTPVMYRTTQDRAFYYDGTEFVTLSYSVAENRAVAMNTLNSVDKSVYYAAEREKVNALIEETKAAIRQCITNLAVDDAMEIFESAMEEIMTIEDYAQLEEAKRSAISQLNEFFAGFSQSDYEEEDWQKLVSVQSEGERVIKDITSIEDVEDVIVGVKLSANNVLTSAEKADFAEYQAVVAASLEKVCEDEVYRDEESSQRAALISEGKLAIAAAESYDEVDALQAFYVSQINALKTNAEWEEEEKNAANSGSSGSLENSDKHENTDTDTETEEEEGCSSSSGGYLAIFSVAVMAALVAIKKKKTEGERR